MNDIEDEQYSKRTSVGSDDLMVTGYRTFRSALLHLPPQDAFHVALNSHIQRSSSH